jgi:hypothetical protein
MMATYLHTKWGGLGAEDNPTKQAHREKRAIMNAYGKAATDVNRVLTEFVPGRRIQRMPTKVARIGEARRVRAERYANQYAPPVQWQRRGVPLGTVSVLSTPRHVEPPKAQELMALEMKHQMDLRAIENIKRHLHMM